MDISPPVTLIDMVAARCMGLGVPEYDVLNVSFTQTVLDMHEAADKWPEFVAISQEVRRYYKPCHFNCHLKRCCALYMSNGVWPEGAGPNETGLQSAEILPFRRH